MQAVFLLAFVAFAALCNAQNHPLTPCNVDTDCTESCPGSTGVCSPATQQIPQPHCHCHDYGEISCKIDDDCKTECGALPGCCHRADHCHCGESCSHHHH